MVWTWLTLILAGGFIWFRLTAHRRLAAMLHRTSAPLDDPTLRDGVAAFEHALDAPRFEIRVLKDMKEINGIALPTGEIYISAGLYDRYRRGAVDRDEVLSVIAHEIGHVALGHARARQSAWQVETAALVGLAAILGRALFGWIGLLLGLALGLLRSRVSRRDEFEADAFAAQLLMRAGDDPTASIRLLGKLQRIAGPAAAEPGLLRWLMSHPPIPERIAAIEQVIAAGDPRARALAGDAAA